MTSPLSHRAGIDLPDHVEAVLFDVGDTLVHAAAPDTPVDALAVALRPSVHEDLTALHQAGVRLAAVTDTAVMTEGDVRALFATAGLEAMFEVVVTSVDVGARKPDPTSLVTVLERLGVDAGRSLFVGDRVIDRDAARAAGIAFAFIGDTIAATLARWLDRAVGPFDAAAAEWRQEADRRAMARSGAGAAARARLDSLAKPPGSLGRVEDLAIRLCEVAECCPPPRPHPVQVVVFAADHGVHAEGVSAWPQEITTAMVDAIAGSLASINALSAAAGAGVSIVDVGVAGPPSSSPVVEHARVRAGTRNLAVEPAMTLAEAMQALDVGAAAANRLIDDGVGCLVTGEMGIANTTAATALICALTGRAPADLVGRGAGADDATLARKVDVIERALARGGSDDPLEVLATLGGLEIAAMAGLIVAAAARGIPVIVDGVIADAALLAADALVRGVADVVVAGHRSSEPAATAALEAVGLDPVLDLGMRLGEGTGAVLAAPILDAAARLLSEVATIADLS